ncbi:MAG: M1 family metallopeptidase [Saprospiraceae bacterium]|nr:M1 family metallopeptidase [Saprospiraceae bacterium]
MSRFIFLVSIALIIGSCSSSMQLAGTDPIPLPMPDDEQEVRNLDTMVVKPEDDLAEAIPSELPVYRATTTREVDLIHTSLDLQFDWQKEAVIGEATLTLAPYFYPIEQVSLDAKGFEIREISLGNGSPLAHEYDQEKLTISLDRSYEMGENIDIQIQYIAYPSTGAEGSAAITSDKGLFFINSDGLDPEKPQQIWTQGETEFNSRWFPTVDKPNERCTQEVSLTVDDSFQTLSNGLLRSSIQNENGTRTDHWVLDQPHAPYLFMLAIGKYAVVEEQWNEIPLSYLVEEPFEADAKYIFEHTPEMLSFFSKITGVTYPWPKYAQVVVRDYVSGAMENTTSVIFGEFVQKHRRELIDSDNDYIVAHELFHHWFGDYVTCESWSNLVLNEGFANYGEYLWMEHKDGLNRAESHRMEELQGYLMQASQEVHPLVDFSYQSKEDMFDQHSYNKGGLVLHMLRDLVGDQAFFAALNEYLEQNAYQAVEVHNLRLAFEETTGLDLNWFFNQWYLSAGHPEIEYKTEWDEVTKSLTLTINQIQDPTEVPAIFILPTEADIYLSNGSKINVPVEISAREQVVVVPLEEEPLLTVLDPKRTQLAVIQDDFSLEENQLIAKNSNTLPLRSQALTALAKSKSAEIHDLFVSALDDPFWSIRRIAIAGINWKKHAELVDKLKQIAEADLHSMVRVDAIYTLAELDDRAHSPVIAKGINEEDAYPVVATSILALQELNPDLAKVKIKLLEHEQQSDIVAALSTIYAESKDTSHLAYFDKHLFSVKGLPAIDFYRNMESLLENSSPDSLMYWLQKCNTVAKGFTASPYSRIAATRTIINFMKQGEAKKGDLSTDQVATLKAMIDNIISSESNDQVRSIYNSFLSS